MSTLHARHVWLRFNSESLANCNYGNDEIKYCKDKSLQCNGRASLPSFPTMSL